jgi:pseudouridine synthase
MRERLQKILARAGHGSRRSTEALITAGRVTVNGERVTELGAQADPGVDRIELDGQPVSLPTTPVYLVMNKPHGLLTTVSDPRGRRTVMDILPGDLPPHMFPVGRLDRDTEGLLLFTNDGELAHRLAHPRFEIDKEYYALVAGSPAPKALDALRHGVVIEDRRTAPAHVDVVPSPYGYEARDGHTWLRLIIHEGRKRQVRLMCAAVGHPVRSLVRTRIGGIVIGRLPRGKTRPLSAREVQDLRRLVGLGPGS